MIITLFVTGSENRDKRRAELLEHSFIQSGQPGELLRLVAGPDGQPTPMHSLARVERTMPWSPHPYIEDEFRAYNQPAAIMEWLFRERVDATLLLLDPESLLLEPVNRELKPCEAIGNTWRDWPGGDGPFGLSKPYRVLQRFCVNPGLKPSRVKFPILIHSSDLRKMVARWLELTALIRCEVQVPAGAVLEAHQVAYAIAAAEYRVPHQARKLAVVPGDRKADRPILNYQPPIESTKGEIVWDPEVYVPWTDCEPSVAKAGAGRLFLNRLQEFVSLRESGEFLRLRRPRRCHGVREARLPDRTLLEVPGVEQPLNLNATAGALWELCDGHRTLADIADELEQQYDVPRNVLSADIDMAITHLHTGGAVDLETVKHE